MDQEWTWTGSGPELDNIQTELSWPFLSYLNIHKPILKCSYLKEATGEHSDRGIYTHKYNIAQC